MTDRAREALFSSLGGLVVDALVVDLFAGSGSLGLEALSRGARSAVFVERSREAVGCLRKNVEAVGLGGRVVPADVGRYLAVTHDIFDLAFVDPPYALSLASVAELLVGLDGRLVGGATVVLHRRVGEEAPVTPPGWRQVDERVYGDSLLRRFEKVDEDVEAADLRRVGGDGEPESEAAGNAWKGGSGSDPDRREASDRRREEVEIDRQQNVLGELGTTGGASSVGSVDS
jgi:16S rRNA (guanine966-N2)-methyltransferase